MTKEEWCALEKKETNKTVSKMANEFFMEILYILFKLAAVVLICGAGVLGIYLNALPFITHQFFTIYIGFSVVIGALLLIVERSKK